MATSIKARFANGSISPDVKAVRLVIKGLRARLRSDKTFLKKYKKNPRVVLGELGLNRIIQTQILKEDGRVIRAAPGEVAMMIGCAGCSGCCCSGCCATSF